MWQGYARKQTWKKFCVAAVCMWTGEWSMIQSKFYFLFINLWPIPPPTANPRNKPVSWVSFISRTVSGYLLIVPRSNSSYFLSPSHLALPPHHSHWFFLGLWNHSTGITYLLPVTALVTGPQGEDVLCPAWFHMGI